jgi:hypothetical protein
MNYSAGIEVRIIGNGHTIQHYYEIGDVVRIINDQQNCEDMVSCIRLIDGKQQYVSPADLVLADNTHFTVEETLEVL